MNLTQIWQSVIQEITTPITKELKKMEATMSVLSDAIQGITDGVTAISTQITQLSTDVTAEIAALQAKITSGSVQQADLDNLAALSTKLQGAATQLQAIDATAKTAGQ